jgi:hypothetical protein
MKTQKQQDQMSSRQQYMRDIQEADRDFDRNENPSAWNSRFSEAWKRHMARMAEANR